MILLFVLLLAKHDSLKATTLLFTNFSTWQAQTANSTINSFNFSSENVALADEVSSPPAPLTDLGQSLTFQSGNSNLPFDFTFKNESPDPGTEVIYVDNRIGSGRTRNHDWSVNINNWSLDFTSTSTYEVGLDLFGGVDPNTHFTLFDISNNFLASFAGIPDFLGIISDAPIGRILFDDAPTSGGMTLSALFATSGITAVPEPNTLFLLAFGLITVVSIRIKSR